MTLHSYLNYRLCYTPILYIITNNKLTKFCHLSEEQLYYKFDDYFNSILNKCTLEDVTHRFVFSAFVFS